MIVDSRKLEGCQLVVDKIITAGGKAEVVAWHIADTDLMAFLKPLKSMAVTLCNTWHSIN